MALRKARRASMQHPGRVSQANEEEVLQWPSPCLAEIVLHMWTWASCNNNTQNEKIFDFSILNISIFTFLSFLWQRTWNEFCIHPKRGLQEWLDMILSLFYCLTVDKENLLLLSLHFHLLQWETPLFSWLCLFAGSRDGGWDLASALIVFGDGYLIRFSFSCFMCTNEFKEGSAKGKSRCIEDKALFLSKTCLPTDALLTPWWFL